MVTPIRITTEKWMQAGGYTDEQWEAARPMLYSLMLQGKTFTEAVQTLTLLRNNPPSED